MSAGSNTDDWQGRHNEWTYAHRHIKSADVITGLSPIGNTLPANESQCPPLTGLPDTDRQTAWQIVVERAGEEQITASLVKKVVAEIISANEEPTGPCVDSHKATSAVIDELRQMKCLQESHQRLIGEMSDADWDMVQQESSGLLQELLSGSETITAALSRRATDRKEDTRPTSSAKKAVQA